MEFRITSPNWHEEWQSLKLTLAEDKIIYLYVLILILCIYGAISFGGIETKLHYRLTTYLESMVHTTSMTFVLWCTYFYCHMLKNRIAHPTIHLLKTVLAFFSPLSRPLACLLTLLCVSVVLSSYTYMKSIIPDIQFYQYDALFYQLDKVLHAGFSPWEITHAIFAHPLATLILNFFYNLWFFVIWGGLVFFILYRQNQAIRLRFFLSFITCWLVLGCVLATLLSSAGPCYTELLNSSYNYYTPLMLRLQEQNQWLQQNHLPDIWALNIQNVLWHHFEARDQGIGSGISAMPSMHVSMAVLLALAVSALHRRWGYLAWGYALMIQIGSVHLAWHYAVDGYVSTLLTVIIWRSIGWLTQKSEIPR
ncbi:phosphatase PAP2 family protein [Vibrio fluvialis]|nr:phosphatase PAP2 family protein [Vibrio fluvialis]